MSRRRGLVSLLVLILVTSLFLPGLASVGHAEGGLSLSPPLKEVTLGPGLLQTSITVTLKNSTGSPVNASYKLVDLKTLGQYGGNTLNRAGLPDAFGLANWMTLPDGDKQRLEAGQTADIKIIIDNRSDLSPGGHYGALVITTSPDSTTNSSVSLNQQIISLIFVKKLGGETYGLNLVSFSPNNKLHVPDSVTLQFENTGNVHVIPRGYIEVTDSKNKLVSKGIINIDSTFILPDASRQFIVAMQPVSGTRVKGKYTLTVYYRYDGQANFSTKSLTFSNAPALNPLLILLVIGIGLISVIVCMWRYKSLKAKK